MSRALLIWSSLLAAAQMLAGAANMIDLLGPKYAAAFALVVGAAQVATATYQRGLVTPVPGKDEIAG